MAHEIVTKCANHGPGPGGAPSRKRVTAGVALAELRVGRLCGDFSLDIFPCFQHIVIWLCDEKHQRLVQRS